MTQYRLTYFDIDGGRAEPIRIALHAAGIAFEDRRLSFQDFGATRKQYRFRCVPVLEIDGKAFTQSIPLARFAGKLAGLYPDDPMQALCCDEAMGAVEDVTTHVGRTLGMQGDELRAARMGLVDGWLPVYLKGLAELLKRGGGKYFADGRLTVADMMVAGLVGWLSHGALDHIPEDLVMNVAPELAQHAARIMQEPPVAAWYAARKAA
jgi:glutathione S-transferase